MGDLSNFGAGVNMLKGLIGLGVLTLPWATKQIGWLPSIIGMGLIAYMSVSGIFFAVKARRRLDKNLVKRGPDFTTVDEEAVCLFERPMGEFGSADVSRGSASSTYSRFPRSRFTIGSSSFEAVVGYAFGDVGVFLCGGSVLFCQIGTAVAYVGVITTSLESYFPGVDVRVRLFSILGALLTFLSAAPDLRRIAVLSAAGLVAYVGIFLALVYEALHAQRNELAAIVKHEDRNLGAWFGITTFAFGQFSLAVVIYDDMRDKDSFFRVTSWSVGLCWAFYTSFALAGYYCFGDSTEEIIYMNFVPGSASRDGALISVCVVLMLSYGLQMYPVYTCAQRLVDGTLHYTVTRACLIAFTIIVAYLVPNVVTMIETVGAVAGCLVGFILPPLAYFVLSPKLEPWESVMGVLLISLGSAGSLKALHG